MLEGKPRGPRLVTAEGGRDSIQRFAEDRTRARDSHALEARTLGAKDTAVLQVDPRLVQEQPLQPCLVEPKPAAVKPDQVRPLWRDDADLPEMFGHIRLHIAQIA